MITLVPIIRYLNLSENEDIIGIPANISECLVACALKRTLHRELVVMFNAIHYTEEERLVTLLPDDFTEVIEDFDAFPHGMPVTKAKYMEKSRLIPKLVEKGLTM